MAQDLNNNPKIKIGNVEIPEGIDNPNNAKLRITAWIDGDIYDELKKRADKGEGSGKYQTVMNNILREALSGPTLTKSSVSELFERVTALEDIALGKSARKHTRKKA